MSHYPLHDLNQSTPTLRPELPSCTASRLRLFHSHIVTPTSPPPRVRLPDSSCICLAHRLLQQYLASRMSTNTSDFRSPTCRECRPSRLCRLLRHAVETSPDGIQALEVSRQLYTPPNSTGFEHHVRFFDIWLGNSGASHHIKSSSAGMINVTKCSPGTTIRQVQGTTDVEEWGSVLLQVDGSDGM